MTQPGETDGLSSRRHLEMIRDYAPEIQFDYAVLNSQPITLEQSLKYGSEGAEQIGVHGSISGGVINGAKIIYGKLLDDGEKVRHHPEKPARTVLELAARK
jgi:hypothetical protein